MSRKTRKLMWSVPLIAAVAVIGALAAFMMLTPDDASAQNVGIPPGAPTDLTVVPYADTIPEEQLLLTWTEPTDGGSVRQYRIDISYNGGYTWVALESDFRTSSYTHAGLDAGTTHHYRVFALNQHGISPVSNVASGTTDDSTVPGRPTKLTATVGSSSADIEVTSAADLTITLNWDAPIDPPGAPVTSYVVEYSEDGSRWDPVELEDDSETTAEHAMLSAGQGYQYRVAAVNSVGQSGWSATDTDETLPGEIPDPPSVSDFEPGVVPEEVNVWLFWEPGDDPLGDPVTHYEVQGRPKMRDATILGGLPARLDLIRGVTNGPQEPPAEPAGSPDPDDKTATVLTIGGIHFTLTAIDFGETATLAADGTYSDVATVVDTALGTPALPTTAWDAVATTDDADAETSTIVHPVSFTYTPQGGDLEYWSSKKDYTFSTANSGTRAAAPPTSSFTKVPWDPAWDVENMEVSYNGRRFQLTVPMDGGNTGAVSKSAKALPAVESPDGSNLAALLGLSKSSRGLVSMGTIGTATAVDPEATPVVYTIVSPAFKTVDTDISRPEATEIHQFVVTTADVAGTGYGKYFKANIDWDFRVRGINRRAPANATDYDVSIADPIPADTSKTELAVAHWSDNIEATPGSDMALKRPENLVVRRSAEDNQGRTGLTLEWTKSTTAADGNGDTVNAAGYRIEYSDTGTAQRGYDWKVLRTMESGSDDNRQMYVDDEDSLGGAANDLKAGQIRHYRVFALRDSDADTAGIQIDRMSWPSPQQTGNTAPPLRPDSPSNLRATSIGHTHARLEWIAPDATNDDLDGSEEGPSVITHYVVSTSDDEGKTWADLKDEDGMVLMVMDTTYTDDTLLPGQTRDYRVKAVNSSQASVWSNTLDVTTLEAILPNQPGGLVAEAYGATGIKICWNAQAEQPEDAPVTAYIIEYSADGKTGWMELARVTDTAKDSDDVDQVYTIYTDMTLEPEETRHYRVSAVNLRGQSDQSDVAMATTVDASVPDAPTGVTATTASDTQINLSWTAPADPAGASVTGYIIERRYTGDMMMDIPSDGYNTAAMGASFAFSNHMEWWETLNCKGMLAAAGSSETMVATPAEGSDQAMYCAHYANTKPTNMEGTITAGSDVDMKIKALFEKRYEVLTGTATSHMDTMLMANTEYTYRVSATNAKGRSKWSDAKMATTEPSNNAPTKVGEIADVTVTAGQTSDAMDVSGYFNDADEDDTLSYSASSSDEAAATANIPDGSNMLTITGVAAGTADITVTADDSNGGTATQTFMVTVTPAPVELMAPTNIQADPQGSGLVSVEWRTAAGASGYTIIAINVDDVDDYETKILDDETETSTQIALTRGKTYNIYVGSFAGLEFNLNTEERKRVIVE